MKPKIIKTVVNRQRFWQDGGTVKIFTYILAFAAVSACHADTSQPLAEYQPIGYWDALTVTSEGYLRNDENVDSRAAIPLGFTVKGSRLALSVTADIGENSSLWITFGNAENPEHLKLGCVNSAWTLLIGDGLRNFSDPLPVPLSGTHTYRISLDDMLRPASNVSASVDGNPAAQGVPPAPSPSAVAALNPAGWTHATVSLRNEVTLRRLAFGFEPHGALIIVR